MEKRNETPFSLQAMPFLTGPEDRPVLTIIVKGTFDIVPGQRAQAAGEQMEVLFGDELHFPEKGGSVKYESDSVVFKPKADVALVGHAYAPGNVPAQFVEVGLRVGKLKKRLRVTGDRLWQCKSRALPAGFSEPVPFTKVELVYERAFGGIDEKGGDFCAENLVGCGLASKKKMLDGKPLPNIEDPACLITHWQDRPRPAGFGFCGKAWEPRRSHLGTYDNEWRRKRAPYPPLDFRFDYYNAAHPDLQVAGYLQGDEEIELVNVTADGYLRAQLPGVVIKCEVFKSDKLLAALRATNDQAAHNAAGGDTGGAASPPDSVEAVQMNLDTLCLIPDEKKLYLVWRGLCPIRDIIGLEVQTVAISMRG